MRLCPKCHTQRYTKHRSKCPICSNMMIQVDGRLRKVVESLAKSEYQIAYAMCETYTTTGMCTAEIIICFLEPYDKFIFQDLPEHFEFISDKYGNNAPYALNYVLNHIGRPMSMIIYDYCGHPDKSKPAKVVLKEAIADLHTWAKNVEQNKWFIYKLGGWL